MTPRKRLDVYVAAHCATCAEARRLAKIAGTEFHDVMVHVIDVDDHTDIGGGGNKDHSDQVVAVPTYILDGRVIALGNPSQEELFAALAAPHASPAQPTQRPQDAQPAPSTKPPSGRNLS